MSKPESIKNDPWTEWPKQAYSIVTDDFVHDKLFTTKINTKGAKSVVNLKVNVKSDKNGYKIADQVKYWFNLPEGRSFYSKVKSSDYIKVHLDNGIVEKWNKKWNLYATLNLTKTLSNASLRLGAGHRSGDYESDNRLKVDFQDDKHNLTWYNRTIFSKNKFTFGNMLVFNISSQILSKSNFLFAYKVSDKVDAFLRVENNQYRKNKCSIAEIAQQLDTFRLDVVGRHNDAIKYGLEAVFRKKTGGNPFEQGLAVIQHDDKEKKRTTKAKISSKGDISLSVKLPSLLLFKDIATTTFSVHGSNVQHNNRKFQAGGQIEFNV